MLLLFFQTPIGQLSLQDAKLEEIDEILGITRACAAEMISNNIYQWNEHYPSQSAFVNDIDREETEKMLFYVPGVYGDYAYSFIGQYTTDTIEVCVGDKGITTSPYDDSVYLLTFLNATSEDALECNTELRKCTSSLSCYGSLLAVPFSLTKSV